MMSIIERKSDYRTSIASILGERMARYTLELGGKSAAMVLVAQRAGTVGYEILAVAKIEPLATLGITQAFVTTPA